MNLFKVATINAFVDGTLKGNAAGVCLLDAFPGDASMQDIATRMGHAETAFIVKRAYNNYELRWFTPTQEVPLCGHAALAAAHYLRQNNQVNSAAPVRFNTKSGELLANIEGENITLQLPKNAGTEIAITDELNACLGVDIKSAKYNGVSYLVEVADMKALRNCGPSLTNIAKLNSEDLIVTTATGVDGFDYAYRCFCPQVGIPEDAVTGSANCILAPHWAAKLGKNDFVALQASNSGGALNIGLRNDHVAVGGKALTINTTTIDLGRPSQAAGIA